MFCSLCLEEINPNQEAIAVDACLRHKLCSEEFEKMVDELGKIYDDTCGDGYLLSEEHKNG